MTPLELAKAVVERSRTGNVGMPFTHWVQVSIDEAEGIARLAAWAECQQALERYESTDDFQWEDLVAVVEPHGFSDDEGPDIEDFIRGLRDRVVGTGGTRRWVRLPI